jgi:CRP-like cAMP-binding protein
MYFIIQGDCTVNMINENRFNKVAVSFLTEGSHFGEIGLLHKTNRTATVISRNYNTMAVIGLLGFRELVGEFPMFKIALINSSMSHDDTFKLMMHRAIN